MKLTEDGLVDLDWLLSHALLEPEEDWGTSRPKELNLNAYKTRIKFIRWLVLDGMSIEDACKKERVPVDVYHKTSHMWREVRRTPPRLAKDY
jgi:hypothetical protein